MAWAVDALVVFLLVLAVYTFARTPANNNNEHVRVAWALLHGHAWIDDTPVHEMIKAGGHYYSVHPPLAALICLPFVAISGLATNQTSISCILSAIASLLVWRLTRSTWLTVFFAFGTVVFYEGTLGASWGFTLVVSCIPTLLALIELQEHQRPILVGLWAGLAALARNDLVLVIPVYGLLLWCLADRLDLRPPRRGGCAALLLFFCLGLLPCVLFYFWWNHLRLGTWTDDSIWRWYLTDDFHNMRPYGPFSLHYLPDNLYSALFLSPGFSEDFPWIRPTILGQALIFTSPAFLLALRAPLNDRRNLLLWLAVILGLGAAMTCYANGVAQFGCRYTILAEPFLIALMAESEMDQMGKILIGLSVFLVVSGTWTMRAVG